MKAEANNLLIYFSDVHEILLLRKRAASGFCFIKNMNKLEIFSEPALMVFANSCILWTWKSSKINFFAFKC